MLPVESDKPFRGVSAPWGLLLLLSFSVIAWRLSSVVGPTTTETVAKQDPVQVERIAQETAFNTITLTPKAEQRLGIRTVTMERRSVSQTRLYGGELILPLNQLSAGAEKSHSQDKQSVFTILPLMTPADQIRVAEAQVNADGQVEAAKVRVHAARVLLTRAKRLLRDHAGSQRAVDEATVQMRLAQATLAEAMARRELLGPPILAMTNPDRFWIRVPVYVGDLTVINRQQQAQVGSLGKSKAPSWLVANPVSGPPSSNPVAATVDLFYQVANHNKAWQLGQKVQVLLPLTQKEERLVVPWSAVVLDIHGGTWVYKTVAPHSFVRSRVQVSFLSGETAVLASGPMPGTKIVSQGAAELFGTEVGIRH